jgi:hypothetical protein
VKPWVRLGTRSILVLGTRSILVLGTVSILVLGALGCSQASARPRGTGIEASAVVVVGIAGLEWADVTAGRTPTLARLASAGAVGTLSVRAAPPVTCAGEGWLTLGAGRSAAVVPAATADPTAGCGPRTAPPVRSTGGGASVDGWDALSDVNRRLRFGARPGFLGTRMTCTAAVGPGGALAAADSSGTVDVYQPTLPEHPASLLAACPFAAVDLGALPDAAGAARSAALSQLDAALARVDAARPARSTLLVVGVADTDAGAGRLHVAIADGPGFRAGWLRSPSTGRTPYLQLVDVAPTVLAALGQPVPDDIAGRPIFRATDKRPASFAAIRAKLVDTDAAAVARKHLVGPFLAGFAVLCALGYTTAAFLLHRRRRTETGGRPFAVASLGLTALGAFPVATFMANLVPWWRVHPTALALAAAILGSMALVTAIAAVPRWGATASGRAGAVAAVTVAVLLGDVVGGARLQLNSLLGYTALEAGRFVGFGNVAFAVLGAAALLLAAVLATGRSTRNAVAIVTVVAVPVIVVEGAPGWGTDFGGILTLVPTFGVLALLVAGLRVSLGRLVGVLGAGAAAVTILSVADYLRPDEDRTHFGRFVASVIDGDGLSTIDRKVRANFGLLFGSLGSIVAALLLIAVAVAVFRPPGPLRAVYAAQPGLRTGLRVVVVLGVLGFAVNDSGVAIPMNAALVALPAAVAACLRPEPGSRKSRGTTGGTPGETSEDQPVDGDEPADKPVDTPARAAGAPADVLP